MANIPEDYQNKHMPFKDMANTDALLRATMSSALEGAPAISSGPLASSLIEIKNRMSHYERPDMAKLESALTKEPVVNPSNSFFRNLRKFNLTLFKDKAATPETSAPKPKNTPKMGK